MTMMKNGACASTARAPASMARTARPTPEERMTRLANRSMHKSPSQSPGRLAQAAAAGSRGPFRPHNGPALRITAQSFKIAWICPPMAALRGA